MSGKGSAPRKGQNLSKYAQNYALIDWSVTKTDQNLSQFGKNTERIRKKKPNLAKNATI